MSGADVDNIGSGHVQIGRRFVCDGRVGTVRFVGRVPPTQGLWLGVEWDDANRGKHDGTHDGQRYFYTSHPMSGSFLRPKSADFGCSCLEAIRSKYAKASQDCDDDDDDNGHLHIIQRNNVILPVEPVGYAKIASKQSQLDQLRVICLSDARVSHAGPMGELRDAVPNVQELNLSRSLFTSWNDVADVCAQIRRLVTLYVSCNRLRLPDRHLSLPFTSVRVLVMNRMAYNWTQILQVCSAMFPRVEQLSVAFNDIDRLETPAGSFESLGSLDLQGNRIESWKEVNKLGRVLGRLKTLNLNATRLSGVSFADDSDAANVFPSLESLLLHDNCISDWHDINELNRLPSLVELQISNNPVTETPDVGRLIIIARIGRLKLLNRTVISAAERRSAELDYLKRYGRDWLRAVHTSTESHFLADHPRFRHLIQVHGAAEESEIDTRPVALKNSLISLEIRCPQMERPVSRKLPGTMNVQKFRSLVHRLTKLDDPVLHCESCKKPGHETEMDNDMRQLSFYADDGDTIWVGGSRSFITIRSAAAECTHCF